MLRSYEVKKKIFLMIKNKKTNEMSLYNVFVEM